MIDRKEIGNIGENLARDFIRKRGYRIIENNYRCPCGEIDIIAMHKDCLVFIEVRTKTSLSYGTPEESISSNKKAKMRLTAAYYLQSREKYPKSWRIDFIAVEIDNNAKAKRIEIFENAVDEN
jgi:putative endonuclease